MDASRFQVMFRGGACRLVSFACDLEGELLRSSQNPSLGRRPPGASGKASERTASPKLGAAASPRVVFTHADSWARHRMLTWLRNTKLVKVLTSEVLIFRIIRRDKKNILK